MAITDALEMKGAAGAAGGIPPAAVRPLAAGADLLCIGAQVDEALAEAVAVVVGRHTHRTEASRALIERLAAGHTVAVVEMGRPSGWRPAGARAFVTTYGASHANGRAEALGLAHPTASLRGTRQRRVQARRCLVCHTS